MYDRNQQDLFSQADGPVRSVTLLEHGDHLPPGQRYTSPFPERALLIERIDDTYAFTATLTTFPEEEPADRYTTRRFVDDVGAAIAQCATPKMKPRVTRSERWGIDFFKWAPSATLVLPVSSLGHESLESLATDLLPRLYPAIRVTSVEYWYEPNVP